MSPPFSPAGLLDLTARGAAVALLAGALDGLAGRWLAARHRRLLWLLAALAFLVPFCWSVPVLPPSAAIPGWALAAPGELPTAPDAGLPPPRPGGVPLVLALWAAGTLAAFGLVIGRTVRASRRWNGHRFSTDAALLDLVEDCRSLARVRAPVGVIVSGSVESPALLGWLRPRLLLPARWVENCAPAQLRDVLLHELAHLRSADLAWGWFVTTAQAIHWFNPLAHLVARRWRAAREDAADEFVLRRRPASAISYDQTLLAFLRSAVRPHPFGALGISENLLHLKHRIHMIQNHPRRVLPTLAAALLLASVAALAFVRPARAEASEADQKTAAVAAMTKWLEGIDQGAYGPSWTEAAPSFRKALTQDQWVAALDAARKPAGACKSRDLASAMWQEGIPGANGQKTPGTFVIAQFKTSFANLVSAVETVTFERTSDGAWKASGYFIKPG